MECVIARDTANHSEQLGNDEARDDAIAELSTRLKQAAFRAMRLELSISPYAGKTTAADMSGAIDTEMFDNLSESLMNIIEKGLDDGY